ALPTALALRHSHDAWVIVGTAGAAILGHCFSPFLGFKVGKGVATTFGVFVILSPIVAALGAVVFAGILAITRIPALASLIAVASMAMTLIRLEDLPWATFGLGCVALVVYTHRSNLAELMSRPAA
ncbi:MAG: glycerol-3-phosphate acyltransferase, partial [Kofleriaceae bacterium]